MGRWIVMEASGRAEQVMRWSAAITRFDPLEPWLTESHVDEAYWNDVAGLIVDRVGDSRQEAVLLSVVRESFEAMFPRVSLESDNGFYRDSLPERFERIVREVLGATDS
jgi:hypothetical protein